MMKCKDCKWWDFTEEQEITKDLRSIVGFCRRNPPLFAALFTKDLEWADGVWPETEGKNDWCGEFEAKEIKPSPGAHA